MMLTSCTSISTTSTIEGYAFEVPSLVLQTAATPLSANGSIDLNWTAPDTSIVYFVVLHFAEIQILQTNSLREFYIYENGELYFKDPVPVNNYLSPSFAWYVTTGHIDYNISLKSSARATLPPILNAFELYTILPVAWLPTDNGEVTAINSIKASYGISKGWNGDPCVPPSLQWAGVNCSIDSTNIPKITSLDLSYNNLFGNIPGSLDQLKLFNDKCDVLELLSVTYSYVNKKVLITCFNSEPRRTGHKNSSKAVIIVVVVLVFLILGAAALSLLYLMKIRINPPTDHEGPGNFAISNVTENPEDSTLSEKGVKELNIDKRKFSFAELKVVTNNFRDQIGIGGFGKVFKGSLEDGNEVAVKVRSELSPQGIEQFLNEVKKLSRVHHKNLVSLIGYCIDGDHIALVYEHMEKGNLQQWIRGTADSLSWKQRLQIAYDSAQGCQYLHKMCKPPLIHRDIKSNNILLTANFEAKVSDLGSARDYSGTHVTTKVIGTLGYLDPFYASTSELTEKSDVYSFGVVLLEIVTGKSPILEGPGGSRYNLNQFVQERLSKGNIESILDPNMEGQYNINSIWKVADLALKCTGSPAWRPDMTEIVRELEESLNLEMSCISRYSISREVDDGNFKMAHTGGMQQPDYGPSAR
ncbi:Leucine-rich repeat protein kinase family protein [Rhynchospora pubera]|uniref:Leucine-rich repeat protein kinase family protein n=1 Tax=Rhynchospora pubera TaxID=906938 RepID=A0AAV8DZC4_9POAL|nr:Leucine-rich repeat protein kinase family protein [Rhynchospora pubera]